jgi:hypothetical protein
MAQSRFFVWGWLIFSISSAVAQPVTLTQEEVQRVVNDLVRRDPVVNLLLQKQQAAQPQPQPQSEKEKNEAK